ncbi:MAG: ATP-binding cassette domain-containing protein [Bacteroidota bacterium]
MLSIEQLRVSYGRKLVLDGLSAEFQPGEIHGVLGMNGAGKTTFFNAVYGFVGKNAGQCLYHGKPVTSRDIAFLETHGFFYPHMSGREYLQLLALGNPSFEIEEWNRLFNLPLDATVDQYSTGMSKKLGFLGVLALDRPIMILDEPFNGVDVESNEKIDQVLKRLKASNKIILLSSHIIRGMTDICDRISYLEGGKIAKTYKKSEFADLEIQLKDLIKQEIDETLNQLFKTV